MNGAAGGAHVDDAADHHQVIVQPRGAAIADLQVGDGIDAAAPFMFTALVDAQTGRAKIRLVDTRSARYAIARRYMIRLRQDDFDNPADLAKFAATAGITVEEFKKQFAYLVETEPPPLTLVTPS